MRRLRSFAGGPGASCLRYAFFCFSALLVAAGRGRPPSQPGAPNSPASSHGHVFLRVRSAVSERVPISGRLLIFMRQGSGDKDLGASEFDAAIGSPVIWMVAKEIRNLSPGGTVDVDAGEIADPKPFSAMPPGAYEAQAVLDVGHTYNYSGNSPANWTSDVMAIDNWNPATSAEPILDLNRHPAENMKRKAARLLSIAVHRLKFSSVRLEELTSPALGHFWGRPVKISAWIVLPPGYNGKGAATYPAVYWTHGFGGGLDSALFKGNRIREKMSC